MKKSRTRKAKRTPPKRKPAKAREVPSFGFVREVVYWKPSDGRTYSHKFKREPKIGFTGSGTLLVIGPVRRLKGDWIEDAKA